MALFCPCEKLPVCDLLIEKFGNEFVTLKFLITGVAATKLTFPPWVAVIEQRPTETSVAEVPDTVQTAGVVLAKLTTKPELAVAVSATGPAFSAVFGGWLKVITLVF